MASGSTLIDMTPSFIGSCIPMSDNLFGLLTASYTVGGLIGSIYASQLADLQGRKKTLMIASGLVLFGSALMAISNVFLPILLGRTIVGIGCGLNTVVVPIYLSEISPVPIRGSVGVMNQLAIVTGIFISQLISLPLSMPSIWRWIFVFSACLSGLQLLTSPFMIESSKWAMEQERKRLESMKAPSSDHDQLTSSSSNKNLTFNNGDAPEQQGLLESRDHRSLNQVEAQNSPSRENFTMSQMLKHSRHDPALALGLRVVIITQLAQQLSGINAVLYYSTSIMKSVLPTQAIYISLFVSAINLLMTFVPVFLVDKLGRKSLLLISSGSMALSSFVLAFSINIGFVVISSLAIVLFVASFSVGLGPVPFVILSEVVPNYAVSAAGSFGLAVNWASNFAVGLAFLPLRNLMSSPDGDGDGNIFLVFTCLSTLATILIFKNFY